MLSATNQESLEYSAFRTAKARFRELQTAKETILNLWRQALPRYQNQIAEFLKKEFADNLLLFTGNDLNNFLTKTAQIVPWTVKDMNAYYKARNDSDRIQEILIERRKLIISQRSFTRFDNYQLIRDEHAPAIIAKRKVYFDQLAHLDLIYQSSALLDQSVVAEECLISHIVKILHILKLELIAIPAEDAEPMPVTEKVNLICKIDACCEFISAYFLRVISTYQVNENQTFLKKTFDELGQLDNEIFPWLSLTFQDSLPFDEEEANQITEEFLKFHCLKYEKSIGELILNMIGGTAKVLQTNELNYSRKAWYHLNKTSYREQLAFIGKYICQSEVSDWMMLNFAMNVVYRYSQETLEPKEVLTLARLFARIRNNAFLLPQAHAYLLHAARDLRINLDNIPNSTKDLCVVIEAGDKAALKARVQFLNHYPPLAELFYDDAVVEEGLDSTESTNLQAVILDSVMRNDSQVSHAYLTALFSDDNYADQHQRFFLSEIPHKLGLQATDFPLIALRLHYTQQQVAEDVLGLWEAFLDQDSITETEFLKYETNRNLISHIVTIKDELITAEKISLYPQRYKKLLLALELYRSTGVDIMDLGILMGVIVGYPENKKWALGCINFIVNNVAYPNGARQMNFQNVNNFLGLEIGSPTALNNISHALFDFAVQHPNYNLNFSNALVLMFMKLYREKNLSDAQIYKLKSIPPEKLPPACHAWLDLNLLKKYILFPIYADTLYIHKIECLYSTELSKQFMSMAGYAEAVGFAASMRRFGEGQFEQSIDLINNVMSGMGLNINSDPQIRFMQELYYAYCLNKQALNSLNCDTAYLELYNTNVTDAYIKGQVAAFIKIYAALRAAQSGFFKTDWVAEHQIDKMPPAEALRFITEHAGKPNSRTRKAWELAKKYNFDADPENIYLIQKIYAYGFSHSGLFKRSTSLQETFFRSASLNEKLATIDLETFETLIQDNNSRLSKTVRALR